MQAFEYLAPTTINELLDIIQQTHGYIIAGGTDLIPKIRKGMLLPQTIIDISHFDDWRGVNGSEKSISIGALTTHQTIATSLDLQGYSTSLSQAAQTIGCPQTRNRGTIGGNIANASPSADLIPPLLTYEAEIVVRNKNGERSVPLQSFITGPGQTCLQKGELITHITYKPVVNAGSTFLKLGKRKGMAISVASAACLIMIDENGLIQKARIAMGAVAPTIIRSQKAEKFLEGEHPDEELFLECARIAVTDCSPITDIRASAKYRIETIFVLVKRALEQASQAAISRSQK